MPLIEIKAEIPAASADEVDTLLLELEASAWSLLEDSIAKRAWIVGIFPGPAEADESWTALRACLQTPVTDPVIRTLADADWRDSYKAHFKASQFGRLHWVPIWERPTFVAPSSSAVLWLDPGLAFGTGNHETTRLCAESLVEIVSKRKGPLNVVDAGCGSGILALSAVLLGQGPVSGFDLDSEAVRVSEENAVLNGLEKKARFFTADLVAGLDGVLADIVLANIQADILIRFARELVCAVAPEGALVLSGILATEIESVKAAFTALAPNWSCQSRVMGEWCSLVLLRPLP